MWLNGLRQHGFGLIRLSLTLTACAILLLDMNYLPVNVLENVNSAGVGQPVYTALHWLAPSQVPSSTWDMSVPGGFSMGALPSQP